MNDLTRYRLFAGLRAPATAKLIYCYLLDRTGGRHRSITVSTRSLAADMGLSRSATGRNLRRLRHLGLLSVSPRYTEDGGRLSNEYKLK